MVVLEYEYQGHHAGRTWPENGSGKFNALIKMRLEQGGKIKVIEKPSVHPATLEEFTIAAKKMIEVHGSKLKQLMIWNMDEMKKRYPEQCK
jgi:hypothetical protein